MINKKKSVNYPFNNAHILSVSNFLLQCQSVTLFRGINSNKTAKQETNICWKIMTRTCIPYSIPGLYCVIESCLLHSWLCQELTYCCLLFTHWLLIFFIPPLCASEARYCPVKAGSREQTPSSTLPLSSSYSPALQTLPDRGIRQNKQIQPRE